MTASLYYCYGPEMAGRKGEGRGVGAPTDARLGVLWGRGVASSPPLCRDALVMAGVAAMMKSSCHGRGTLAAHRYSLLLLLLLVLLQAHVGHASRDDITRQQVFVGENITLKCYAKQDHLQSYRWVYIRQGTKRPQVLSSGRTLIVQEPRFSLITQMEGGKVNLELKLTDVRSHESGLFMCWRQGQKPDPQVLVTILEHGSQSERQTVVHSESPAVVQYGEAATFSCYIQPAWPVRVTWLKDGKMISWRDRLYTQTKKRLLGNTQGQEQHTQDDQLVASLFVASVRQNASFTCRIETSPPEEHSMQVTVRVPRVDSLTAEPDKDLVEYGQPLTLTCTVSGSNSEVLWLKDGSELVFGAVFPKRRKQSTMHPPNRLVSTVHFESISFADNGQYVCYIPGASKHILINIEDRPPRLLGVTGNNFYEDEELSLRCTTQYAKNAGTQVTITWTFEGAVINPNAYESLTYPGEHNTTVHQLVLTHASARNIGTYQCITPFGSAQIYVEMYAPPSLSEPLPSEVHFQEGEFFQLPCLTIGHPLPSVHWEKKAGDRWEVVEGSEGSGSSSELIFPRASASDAGSYRCVAKSEAGSFLAEIFAVMERPDPEVLEIIAPETVIVGENFTIQCTVRNWEAEVEFTLNGASLMSSLAERFNVLRYPMEESLTEAFLIVRDSELQDSGQYRCSAGAAVSLPAPVLIKLPEARVVGLSASAPVVGRDLNITCVVNNWDGLVTFVFNNEAVEPQSNGWRYAIFPGVEGDTVTTHILTVPTATHHHSGRYECFTTPSSSRSLNINVWDVPEVTLELQDKEELNWRDAPIPIACKIKGISPDMVTVLFSHEDTPQVSIQNRTKMSTSSQLVNVAVSEGEEGDEPLTIFTLGFYSLSKDFEGLWSCEVFLPSGDSLSKDTLYMEIYEPPEFVNPPPEQLFQEDGTDLRLNCSVSGPPETMVAWYRQGIQEPIVFDRMSALLFIPRFTTTDEGYYVCRASSHGREIQTNTYLSLGTPQPRVESVVASPAVVGQEFSVTCTVSNWDREVVFFHNKEPLDFRPDSRYFKEQQGVLQDEVEQHHLMAHTLRVADATHTDSGVVECFLTTEIFGSINVTVMDVPATDVTVHASQPTLPLGQIVQLSGPQTAFAGSELVLTCVVSPQVAQDIDIVLVHNTLYLYVGGIVLAEDPRVDIVTDNTNDGSRILYLRIIDVKATDEGTYQCATSTNPPAYSTLVVSVAAPEKPTELPEVVTNLPSVPGVPDLAVTPMLLPGVMDVLGQEGEDIILPCRISPIIDFSISENSRNYFVKWTRGGGSTTQVLSQDDIILHYDGHRMTLNTGVDTRTSGVMHYDLTLRQVVPEDSGVYACTLFDKSLNQIGHREISLDVEMPPEDWKCEFPMEWRGEWYDTRYRQMSEILPQEFKRSFCVSTSGENFIIQHKWRQCFRCVHFHTEAPKLAAVQEHTVHGDPGRAVLHPG
ncbi:hypothetical protein O3P69_007661 [Scylla paramamosain]|uniref:Ig-like domain-containing protein n=1 Tax=Scylla paramamosain TaxID=85552 RepID=A0AAW0UZC0_SCYPA